MACASLGHCGSLADVETETRYIDQNTREAGVSERRRSPISASDRRRLRRIGWLAFSLGVAAAVVPARADEPYKINAILPLTGQASFLGKEEQVTLQIAEKYVNRTGGIKGRPVQFVFYDDTSNPQVAVQLVRQVSA